MAMSGLYPLPMCFWYERQITTNTTFPRRLWHWHACWWLNAIVYVSLSSFFCTAVLVNCRLPHTWPCTSSNSQRNVPQLKLIWGTHLIPFINKYRFESFIHTVEVRLFLKMTVGPRCYLDKRIDNKMFSFFSNSSYEIKKTNRIQNLNTSLVFLMKQILRMNSGGINRYRYNHYATVLNLRNMVNQKATTTFTPRRRPGYTHRDVKIKWTNTTMTAQSQGDVEI